LACSADLGMARIWTAGATESSGGPPKALLCKRTVFLIRSGRQPCQVPAARIRAAHHHQPHTLAGAKAQTFYRPEDAPLGPTVLPRLVLPSSAAPSSRRSVTPSWSRIVPLTYRPAGNETVPPPCLPHAVDAALDGLGVERCAVGPGAERDHGKRGRSARGNASAGVRRNCRLRMVIFLRVFLRGGRRR
jgi:hypothetical protein